MRRLQMQISVVDAPPESVEADILAFPVAEPAALGEVGAQLDGLLAGRLAHLAEDREIKGQLGQLALVHTLGELAAHRLAPVGIGKTTDLDAMLSVRRRPGSSSERAPSAVERSRGRSSLACTSPR